MVFAKSYLPFLPFTETLVTKFVIRYQLCVLSNNRICRFYHYQSFLWPSFLGQSFWRIFRTVTTVKENFDQKLWRTLMEKTNRVTKNNFKIVDVIYSIYILITPYIRMLDSDWLIVVIFFFTNSGLALWICKFALLQRQFLPKMYKSVGYLQNYPRTDKKRRRVVFINFDWQVTLLPV
jgi:hypothetical protein